MRLLMADRPAYYVALGDSMSIDAYAGGPGRGAPSLLYRNRNEDFPEWRGRDLMTAVSGVRLIPLAMDGATSADVRLVQMPRLKEMRVHPILVTVTMGGNDLLKAFGDEAGADAAHRALRENTNAVLAGLRAMMPAESPILVGTVYDPSDGTGDAAALELLPWPGALEWILRFNATLREVAALHGAVVADIHAHFRGHGLDAGDPAQTEPDPPRRDLYYCGVIEPNAWGANAIRQLWWDTLARIGFVKEAAG
jgi:lysophospholipase L1-like esterase